MASVGIGRAIAKGMPYTFAWVGVGATVLADNNRGMSLGYSHDVPVTVHKDGLGTTFALSADEATHTINIRTVPVAPSGTNTVAGAKSMIGLPDILTQVTLARASAVANSEFDGNWIYEGGGSIDFSPDGVPEISMTLHRHGANAAPSGAYTPVQAFS